MDHLHLSVLPFAIRSSDDGRSREALSLCVQLTLHPRFGTHPSSDSRSQSQSPFAPFPGCIHSFTFITFGHSTRDLHLRTTHFSLIFWPFATRETSTSCRGCGRWQASFAASTWCLVLFTSLELGQISKSFLICTMLKLRGKLGIRLHFTPSKSVYWKYHHRIFTSPNSISLEKRTSSLA